MAQDKDQEQPTNTIDLKDREKHAGGRKSKLTQRFINALKEVLEGENVILVYTDEDLIDAVNEKLEKEERISRRTFLSWKKKAKESKKSGIDEIGTQFLRIYKRALLVERANIIQSLKLAKPGEWQKYAWLMERKFKEWNIKTIVVGDKDNDPVRVQWVKGKNE